MKRVGLSIGVVVITGAVLLVAAERPTTRPQGRDEPAAERGRYLVHHVAMCIQCHTSRDEEGALIEDKLLKGAPVPLRSPYPDSMEWAMRAPAIAGLGGFDERDVRRTLMEGLGHDGLPPKQPMPPFRMNREDADAVIAYLKSVR